MTSVLLIYPYFSPLIDRSVFRFPPLGPAYIASALQKAGHKVRLLDCTFLGKREALNKALEVKAEVVGIYCMSSLFNNCVDFSKILRSSTKLLIAGGPLPTCDPIPFLDYFDVVVRGEGEQTMVELLDAYLMKKDFHQVKGIVFGEKNKTEKNDQIRAIYTEKREFIQDLDMIAMPARELLPIKEYIRSGKKRSGYSITTVMSTRGCPFECEFCSNVVFGGSYRERAPALVVDEIETALALGYERISFADDVFTLNRVRVKKICAEILERGLKFSWECLGRVDSIDAHTAAAMKQAGCSKIYFGIESGNGRMLKLMKKQITVEQAKQAVEIAAQVGIQVGAFFILFYPGDNEESVLETLRFATSLPLDYLGLTLPYTLPGTALFERMVRMKGRDSQPGMKSDALGIWFHRKDFSQIKMNFGILKGKVQFRLNKMPGGKEKLIPRSFERLTDHLFKLMN